MRKIVLSVFTILLLSFSLTAQNQRVSGTVTDPAGEPLVGVTVILKGTTVAAVANVDGQYTINVPANGVLVFEYLGMVTQEVNVAGRTLINVQMQSEAIVMSDVVVTAYRTQAKETFTGSASVVSSVPVLKDLPVTSFENALQGAAAGVQVGVSNGQPGAQVEIRVRGTGSFNASNAPLYVIDGVPVVSGNYSMSGYGGSLGIQNTVNPSDIENITILKDAAATSLYGSRGANGVIMITTKKGKAGVLRVNFKGSWGFSDFTQTNRPVLGGEESHNLALEGAYNQGIYEGMSDAEARLYAKTEADKFYPLRDSYADWDEALTRTGNNANYEVSLSGGNDKTTFYASLGRTNSEGVYYDSDFSGYNGRASISYRDKRWTVLAETALSLNDQHVTPGISGGSVAYANPYYASRSYLGPNFPIYNEDGTYNEKEGFSGNYYNLVADQKKNTSLNSTYRFRNSLTVGYEFFKGLTLKETISYDHINVIGTSIYRKDSKDGASFDGLTSYNTYWDKKLYSSLVLNYDTTIADDHKINALVGWDVDKNDSKQVYAAAKGFSGITLWEMSNASTAHNIPQSWNNADRMQSFFGSVDYSFMNRYYLSATFRRDGSTRLGANTRWGNFWSVSGSWRMKEEDFLKDVSWLDNLRLRLSYGTSGNLPTSLYSHLATYSFGAAYNGEGASYPARSANPNLGWEKNNIFDVGLEARLFDMLSLELDFYNRQTNDLLLSVPISATTGFTTELLNMGGLNNRGIEITIGADILRTKNAFWRSQLILAYNRNKITDLGEDGEEIVSGNYVWRIGESRYSFRTRDWAGVDPGTGDPMWYSYVKDENGNLTGEKFLTKDPAQADRVIVGKANPDWTGGWRNTFSFYGFDLDFLFSFTYGGSSWDSGWAMATDGYYANNIGNKAIAKTQLDRWQKPGDIAKNPRRMHGDGYGNYGSSKWVNSTDHIRLKSLTFGYTFPKRWTEKIYVQNARLFVAGNNLWTPFQAYKDYDPEVGISGETGWAIPALKSVTFGVEISF